MLVGELNLAAGQLIHPLLEAGTELEPLEVPDLLRVPVAQPPEEGEKVVLSEPGPWDGQYTEGVRDPALQLWKPTTAVF